MLNSLRRLILLAVLVASLAAGGSSAIAGGFPSQLPVAPPTPVVISWE